MARHDKLKCELNEYSKYVIEGILLRSKCRWYEEGEKNTKFFMSHEKRNKAKTHVRKLIENAKNITNPKIILNSLQKYYSNLYAPKNIKSKADCRVFLSNINVPKLLPN